MSLPRFQREHTALLVIDMQEKLLPVIHDFQAVEQQVKRMLDGAGVLKLPVLVTEQYKKGLGQTVPEVEARLQNLVHREEKMRFSACTSGLRQQLASLHGGHVLVCGIEAHVCVLQTCLDLVEAGLVVGVVVDAVGSRRPMDRDTALKRLIQMGVVPVTVESVLLEMTQQAGTDLFKSLLPVIR